ncbi:hypothetical protein V7149_00415 [Bacillus sp. JJ1503]
MEYLNLQGKTIQKLEKTDKEIIITFTTGEVLSINKDLQVKAK